MKLSGNVGDNAYCNIVDMHIGFFYCASVKLYEQTLWIIRIKKKHFLKENANFYFFFNVILIVWSSFDVVL